MARQLDPIHPGEILREEFMAPLDLSANALSLALRVPATRIGEIVRGRRGISPETALRLGRYFGTSPEVWMNLQQRYDLEIAREELQPALEKTIQPIDSGSG